MRAGVCARARARGGVRAYVRVYIVREAGTHVFFDLGERQCKEFLLLMKTRVLVVFNSQNKNKKRKQKKNLFAQRIRFQKELKS